MSLDGLGRQKRFKNRPARLLHVGPLRLDESAAGLPGLPERLKNLAASSAHAAMIRVFDAAIEHRVDAVLLSDGFPDPHRIGFRGLALAYEQCRRLIRHEIPVIAAENPAAAGSQFDFLRKPANVHFLAEQPRQVITIGDQSRRGRLDIGTLEMVTNAHLSVAVTGRPLDANATSIKTDLDYIALGSKANPTCWKSHSKTTLWDAGSPQGRSSAETGPHGALLVTLSRGEAAIVQPIACDIIRHHNERIEADGLLTGSARPWDQLHQAIWAQAERIRDDHSVPAHIVRWTVNGQSDSWPIWRSAAGLDDLVQSLRAAFATPASGPAVWTTDISLSTDAVASLGPHDAETAIGRFIQTLSHRRTANRQAAIRLTAPLLV